MALDPQELQAALAAILAPKKAKKTKKPDRIVVVDGVIGTSLVTLKQAKKLAKLSATQDIKIDTYVYEGTLTVDLPISVETKSDEKGEE